MSKTYRFKTHCPRCQRDSVVFTDRPAPAPQANCGECLMDDVKIVTLQCTLIKEDETNDL